MSSTNSVKSISLISAVPCFRIKYDINRHDTDKNIFFKKTYEHLKYPKHSLQLNDPKKRSINLTYTDVLIKYTMSEPAAYNVIELPF